MSGSIRGHVETTAGRSPTTGNPGEASMTPHAVLRVQLNNAGTDVAVGAGSTTMSGAIAVTIATDDTMFSAIKQPTKSVAVTPSDSTDLTGTATKGLWVGTAGNLSVKLSGDSSATTWKNVASGTYVPGNFIRVMAATTATDIVALS